MAGLYIHIPFCHSKCAYCDFYSRRLGSASRGQYIGLLEREWILRRCELPGAGETVDTIYLGGGTPSILGVEDIAALGAWLPQPAADYEFTVEFNPEDVSPEVLNAWRSIGVNRVSMGVQSFSDDELRGVGRRHTAGQAREAYGLLRRHFDNVSIDLIIGLPGQTVESLKSHITTAIALRPEHLSVYILSYEKGTRLWAMRQVGKVAEADDETIGMMYKTVCVMLREAGYEHYEISNFALPGYKACHNSAYWSGEPYLGLGPGAHSYDGRVRRYNPSDISSWTECMRENRCACVVEEESETDSINNYIMTGLRTALGIDLQVIPAVYAKQVRTNLSRLRQDRYMLCGDRLTLPEEAWLTSDDTIARLLVD